MKYDAHIGVEGVKNPRVHARLLELGFHDDGLEGSRITWVKGTPITSCPLIGIHMSKKYESKEVIPQDIQAMKGLLIRYHQTGYGHSEAIMQDQQVLSELPLDLTIEPPFFPLQPHSSPYNKKWDMHISIPKRKLNKDLDALLEEYGFDWIELRKKHKANELYRVFSGQGVNPPSEGRKLYDHTVEWLRKINVPQADCKLEVYIDMFRVGEPKIVPPVIESIKYRN